MTARAVNRRQFEERDRNANVPGKILAAVALFGVAILLLYICFASPQAGTSMGEIKNILCALGGDVAFVLPLILVWIGVLLIGSARGKRPSPLVITCDALLFVCLFTAVHLFSAERICRERMTIQTFANFVSKSYGYGKGGGVIGSLLAWPLYHNLGVAGGFIAVLLLAVLLVTATGRMGRAVRYVGGLSEARRASQKETQVFERVQAKPAGRQARRPVRDPFSEDVVSGAGVPRDKPAKRPARSRAAAVSEMEAPSPRPARAANQPVRRSRPAPQAMEQARTPSRQRPKTAAPAQAVPQNPPRKRKKLYNEEFQKEEQKKQAVKDELFDSFDDLDRLEAESAALDKAEGMAFDKAEKQGKAANARKRSFAPDRPSMMNEKGEIIEDIIDIPEEKPTEQPVVKADKKSNVSIDDLKIQPEAYELPDEDEPPFDMPAKAEKKVEKKAEKIETVEAGIAEKKAFPKIKRVKAAEPSEDDPPAYNYPPIDLLAQGEVEDTSAHGQRDMQKAQLLEDTLQSFGISAKLTGIAHGPAVTRFELQPAPGVKVSRITSLSDDIALNLAAMSVRIEAPIPGKAAVGVEIPNDKVEMVRLRDVLESSEARKHPSRIAVGLGKDNSGRYIVADIAKMPHVLIAGQTGSGKSVCINAIIASILFRASPEEVKLILIDPKVVELSVYNNIPHLVCPVVTDPKKAASALDWAVAEMTKRYKLFAERGVRDIKGYNKSLKEGEKLMPQMVIIIDELADLMMVSPGEVEDSICRLAQLARACGMHLVIATQRPSVNVITGIIKANIPTRIAFSVASQVDSRTMIDHGGAEKLLGNGDMLFVPNGMKSMRVQGAWVSDDEVHNIVEYIKQSGEAEYDPDMLEHMENATRSDAEKEEFEAEYDNKLPEAVDIAIDLGQVSISMLQRKMRIGYARAGRIIDEMSRRGIVSEADGSKPREVLITREQAHEMFEDCA